MKKINFVADWTGKEEFLVADNLTDNEIKVLIASRNNEYGDCIESGTWSFTVCDNSGLNAKVYRGVVSSLIKKDMQEYQEKGTMKYSHLQMKVRICLKRSNL